MKFTLKDYQEDAVRDVLDRLKKARKRWHEDGDKHAFSLTAATGAGKTVIAAAVFEALFFGADDFDFEPDPGAVVVWFSDDPSLNVQSSWRLQEASDKLTVSDLVMVESTFNREVFDEGKIYFLNTQKLSKNSLLVRGQDPDEIGVEMGSDGAPIMPDARTFTIWDTIRNTIDDPKLTLYFVLDEAHRGMKEPSKAADSVKSTIVRRLINGSSGVPSLPIVWGISATVERFNNAVAGMQGHDTLRPVEVSAARVQESGLLKDTINLDVPSGPGDFTTVLARRAGVKLREISAAWADYSAEQGDRESVLPLLVVQVPNSPDEKEIGTWLNAIFESYPDLPPDCIANVFGEHEAEVFGRHYARYIPPERVQHDKNVRILVAKDAISTGWDCPRAEVMLSFRAAVDRTHINQLLGRMVRTPLARRIPGNERLNSVDCLLPRFDQAAVQAVVKALTSGGEGEADLPGRRVLINPREMTPNPAMPEAVWEMLSSLPSQTLPKRHARPVQRLTILAHELAFDGLLADAGKKAHSEMHRTLDQARKLYAKEIEAARGSVMVVKGVTVKADVATGDKTFNDFVEAADLAVIEEVYARAARSFSRDLARTYAEHLAGADGADPDEEQALIDAHVIVGTMGMVPETSAFLNENAEQLSNRWLDQYRVPIKRLNDERQEVYRQIRELSAEPLDVDLARPTVWLQHTRAKEADGSERDLPTFQRHLLCGEDGAFPAELNEWEETVVTTELGRQGVIGWYRNPARVSQDSLGVTYEEDNETKIMRPDFVFFAETPDGRVVADIIDPHGIYLADALPKLRGLARYAEHHRGAFRRIESVAKVGEALKLLDLTEASVRAAVYQATSAKLLYDGSAAKFG
jgi:hypothetical protein